MNSRFLYDVCLSHALEWPSLTVQMLPTPEGSDSKSQTERHLLLGTHTSENEQNYVLMVKVVLPEDEDEDEKMQEAATGDAPSRRARDHRCRTDWSGGSSNTQKYAKARGGDIR